jgi:hypothetical protein
MPRFRSACAPIVKSNFIATNVLPNILTLAGFEAGLTAEAALFRGPATSQGATAAGQEAPSNTARTTRDFVRPRSASATARFLSVMSKSNYQENEFI